jgi:hypothetical protein
MRRQPEPLMGPYVRLGMFAVPCNRRFINAGFFKDGEIVMPKTLNNHSIGSKVFVRRCHAFRGTDEDSKKPQQQTNSVYQVRIVGVTRNRKYDRQSK